MPNVHIRDVPNDALEALRDAADAHGRSLNAELVAALVAHAERESERESLVKRVDAVRRRWRKLNPVGYPEGLEPETVIRSARDAR